MFTGIILAKGCITSLLERDGDLELGVDAAGLDVARIAIGDSVCVQGVCLTVTRKQEGCFFADVSRETMAKTTLGRLKAGSSVNLEPSLRAGDPLGGHLVSGHVDAVGNLRRVDQDARSWRLEFELPSGLTLRSRMTKEEYAQLGLEDGKEVSLQVRNYRILAKEDSALPPEKEFIYQPPPTIAEHI